MENGSPLAPLLLDMQRQLAATYALIGQMSSPADTNPFLRPSPSRGAAFAASPAAASSGDTPFPCFVRVVVPSAEVHLAPPPAAGGPHSSSSSSSSFSPALALRSVARGVSLVAVERVRSAPSGQSFLRVPSGFVREEDVEYLPVSLTGAVSPAMLPVPGGGAAASSLQQQSPQQFCSPVIRRTTVRTASTFATGGGGGGGAGVATGATAARTPDLGPSAAAPPLASPSASMLLEYEERNRKMQHELDDVKAMMRQLLAEKEKEKERQRADNGGTPSPSKAKNGGAQRPLLDEVYGGRQTGDDESD